MLTTIAVTYPEMRIRVRIPYPYTILKKVRTCYVNASQFFKSIRTYYVYASQFSNRPVPITFTQVTFSNQPVPITFMLYAKEIFRSTHTQLVSKFHSRKIKNLQLDFFS